MKIDVSKIEGFDSMTAEQKVEALTSYEYDDNKALLSQRNAENAAKKKEIEDLKAQLAAKMTADEKAEAERMEAEKAREEELKSLRRQVFVSNTAAKYIGLGYTAENAKKTAEALADGDLDTVFNIQSEFQNNLKATLTAEALKGTLPPQGKQGNPDHPDFDSMSDSEYYTYLQRLNNGK